MTASGRQEPAPLSRSHPGRFFLFERRDEALLSHGDFHLRLRRRVIAAILLVGILLRIGPSGHHLTEGLPWVESLLDASMILGGMGPVDRLHSTAGKIFASAHSM
jgi:hypothetical protein